MNAIAIDDEPIALEIVASHASKVSFINLKATFTNAFEANSYLQQNKIDLIFLDIKMPDISGIDFLKSLNKPPLIIFTTAYSEHAVQSFELDAVDYLLKPFSLPRFLKACNKAKELFDLRLKNPDKTLDHLFVKDGYQQIKVMFDEIVYIEADGNYTQFHLLNEKLMSSRITLNDLAEVLPKNFVRIHRAFIVAKEKISKFDRNEVYVGNKIIPIGATYSDCLKEQG
jgi:two-component system LytT family response regulator